MPTNLELARDLYDAFARADAAGLVALLHPQFVGHVSDGLPGGFGGTHRGPEMMLAEAWAPVFRRFAVRPVPDRLIACEDGEVIAIGSYVGDPPGAEQALRAAFAHVLAFREGRIAELRQITDTQIWSEAAASANTAAVRRLFEAVERRDAEALLRSYTEDVVITEPESLPYGGVYRCHDGALQHGAAYLQTWGHLQTDEDRRLEPTIRDAGHRVFVQWRQKATAPDGRHLDLPAVDVIELRDGQVASLKMFHHDTAALLNFLAAANAPPAS